MQTRVHLLAMLCSCADGPVIAFLQSLREFQPLKNLSWFPAKVGTVALGLVATGGFPPGAAGREGSEVEPGVR